MGKGLLAVLVRRDGDIISSSAGAAGESATIGAVYLEDRLTLNLLDISKIE